MLLNKKSIIDHKQEWTEASYHLPAFDIEKVLENTLDHPEWVHFGGGNLFRAYHAALASKMLEQGICDTGVIVVEGYDYEIIDAYRQNDYLSINATLKSDGSVVKDVLGSIPVGYKLDFTDANEIEPLKAVFAKESLKMATFTITEKGYATQDTKGNVIPVIAKDFQTGPNNPESYLGKVAALIYHRYLNGKYPLALVSTDNCSHNGDKLKAAIDAYVSNWIQNGLCEKEFGEYIQNAVSFPISMIDKITPRPDAKVEAILRQDGVEGLEPVQTKKNSFIAPFVNAEETEYLVIEDLFPNGKLPLEKVGVIFTDMATVDAVEVMKVGTCLNPLHTALAIFGCLLGHTLISQEMQDPELVALIKQLGYVEGMKVVEDPGIIHPQDFIDTCINIRFPNPFMPDSPQRIATDSSQKLGVRYGTTVTRYIERNLDVQSLKAIPLIYAGWIRYLTAINDELEPFALSPDPLFDEVLPYVEGLNAENVEEKIAPLLHNANIFRFDLYEIGLANKVIENVKGMLQGKGSIRQTIQKVLGE